MSKTLKLSAIATLIAVVLCACGDDKPKPEKDMERVIIYSIGETESKMTLETNAQWDNLLELLCTQAAKGNVVSFYNMDPKTYYYMPAQKGKVTFTTSSREEMIAWMKEMEKQGKTVIVKFDDNTGKWNGTAYATSPASNTSELIVGTWHFVSLTSIETDANGNISNDELFFPEHDQGAMFYTFSDNGTVTLTVEPLEGLEFSDEAEWTLSENGELYCELLPNKANWNVNWISTSTMIISSNIAESGNNNITYQIKFEKQ